MDVPLQAPGGGLEMDVGGQRQRHRIDGTGLDHLLIAVVAGDRVELGRPFRMPVDDLLTQLFEAFSTGLGDGRELDAGQAKQSLGVGLAHPETDDTEAKGRACHGYLLGRML
jgi:hypothetical protein